VKCIYVELPENKLQFIVYLNQCTLSSYVPTAYIIPYTIKTYDISILSGTVHSNRTVAVLLHKYSLFQIVGI